MDSVYGSTQLVFPFRQLFHEFLLLRVVITEVTPTPVSRAPFLMFVRPKRSLLRQSERRENAGKMAKIGEKTARKCRNE